MLNASWRAVVEDLLAQSEKPNSDVPNFNHTQRLDLHLISEGRHERLWDVLGANLKSYDTDLGTVDGVAFAVWGRAAGLGGGSGRGWCV